MKELNQSQLQEVSGGLPILALAGVPVAAKVFAAGAAFGAGLVIAAYKLV